MFPSNVTDRHSYLLGLLRQHEVEITFTKVNGDERTMPCTLVDNKLPKQEITEVKERKRSTETISVWCTDKNEWRSFRVANVTKFTVLDK